MNMQQGWLTKTFKGDRAIWGLVALFMFYSLLAVYSSSVGVAFMKYGGNTTYFLRSQFFMLVLSLDNNCCGPLPSIQDIFFNGRADSDCKLLDC